MLRGTLKSSHLSIDKSSGGVVIFSGFYVINSQWPLAAAATSH